MIEIMIQGSTGKLSIIIQKPELANDEKCPLVIIMHGILCSKEGEIEKDLAEKLEKLGIASIRFDFNGHGKSEGDLQHMTPLNEIQDAKMVYTYAAALPFVSKVAMCGHSLGGVVASMVAGELECDKIACVVLMAPAAVLREDAIRGMTMGVLYDPFDPPEYIELPDDLKLGREYLTTSCDIPIYETASKYTGKACIIHGAKDIIVPYTYGERYHQIWKDSELHILDGIDHMFSEEGLENATNIATTFLSRQLL